MYLSLRGFFPPSQVSRLLGISEPAVAQAAEQVTEGPVPTGANGFNYLEFKRYMHDQLLRDSDVFSMAHSIELRVPLLDHKIVEYAARLTPAAKLAGAINKPVLVGAVDDPLLREAAGRRKQGFSFPMDRWMKEHGDQLEEMSQQGSWVDRDEARSLWKQFRAGRLHWSRAWALTVLGARN
jgi:asparagine synthase (glutamine-hydrolysing)